MGKIMYYVCPQCDYRKKALEGGGFLCNKGLFVCNKCRIIQDISTYVFTSKNYRRKREKGFIGWLHYKLNRKKYGQECTPQCSVCRQSDQLQLWDGAHCPKCESEMSKENIGLWD